MRRMIPFIMALGCLLFCALLGVASIFEEDRREAELENRSLQTWPKWSLEEAMQGDYFATMDTYLSDQLFLREGIYTSYVLAQKNAGFTRISDVLLGKNENLLAYYAYSHEDEVVLENKQKKIEKNYRIIEALDAAMKARGGHLVFVQMPAKRIVHWEDYPAFYQNYRETSPREFAIFQQAMEERGIPCIDLRDAFFESEEDCYFKTDHHINSAGAQVAYDVILDALESFDGRISRYSFDWDTVNKPLQGSYNRKLAGVIPNEDRIRVATPEGGYMPYTRYDTDRDTGKLSQSGAPLVDISDDSLRYNAYMGRDHGQTVIETGREDLPNLLMTGDSYTNILEPLLFCSFNETSYLDTRYYPGEESLLEYIEEHDIDVFVMLYTAPLANLYITEDLRAEPLGG